MPEISIVIGGRSYAVACQDGEEQYLTAAAKLLDIEAAALGAQAATLPEARMLLMAGLMLADKAAGHEERMQAAEARLRQREAEVEALRAGETPPPMSSSEPERVEVAVLPDGLYEDLTALTEEAEQLAQKAEEKAAALV